MKTKPKGWEKESKRHRDAYYKGKRKSVKIDLNDVKITEHTSTTYRVSDFETTFRPIEGSISLIQTPKGYEMKYLAQDSDPQSPREWDNWGIMVCFHSRYDLGDKHNYSKDDYGSWDDLEKAIKKNEKAIAILPLYLYDHSGITMKTTPFGDRWDSGQVGFIYTTQERLDMMGTKANKKKLEEYLKGEVETYDNYLTGEVYGIVKETYDKKKNQIDVDHVWGFFGYKDALEALKTEI